MAESDPKFDQQAADVLAKPVLIDEQVAAEEAKPKRKWGKLALMISLPLALIIGGVVYWRSLQGEVSTDNAYVHLDKVSVSAEVGGKITAVLVKENQHVNAGDLLFRIDPQPFQLQLAQADAAIATAQASQTALQSDSALSGADASAAREQIAFAQSNLARQEALWKKGFTTKAAYQAAQHQVAIGLAILHLLLAVVFAKLAKPSGKPAFPFTRAEFEKDREWIENFQKTSKSNN